MFLSPYAKREWITIILVGLMVTVSMLMLGWWPLAVLAVLVSVAILTFFRDPERPIPSQRGVMVAPADGRVSSVHLLEHFEPLGGPALCIRIFLSVLNVHVNRSPCHGAVASVTHTPGEHRNALNPESAESNENTLVLLVHPIRRHPVAAVRQVAGLLARTIYCDLKEGQVIQRGERFGIIKLGSTTELYVPMDLKPEAQVQEGQRVQGGKTVVLSFTPKENLARPAHEEGEEGGEEDASAESVGPTLATEAGVASGVAVSAAAPTILSEEPVTDPAAEAAGALLVEEEAADTVSEDAESAQPEQEASEEEEPTWQAPAEVGEAARSAPQESPLPEERAGESPQAAVTPTRPASDRQVAPAATLFSIEEPELTQEPREPEQSERAGSDLSRSCAAGASEAQEKSEPESSGDNKEKGDDQAASPQFPLAP